MAVLDVAGRLPGIAELREHCRVLAIVEAIISPDWESRYYSFNNAWAPGQQMASMHDGSGNEWSIVFGTEGAYVRGHRCGLDRRGSFRHRSVLLPAAARRPTRGGPTERVLLRRLRLHRRPRRAFCQCPPRCRGMAAGLGTRHRVPRPPARTGQGLGRLTSGGTGTLAGPRREGCPSSLSTSTFACTGRPVIRTVWSMVWQPRSTR